MSQPAIDLTSELLRGMRLSGVNYRRIETARPFGVGFSAVAGKAQFHFISRGPVLLRMASGEQFTLESGDALFIPNGDRGWVACGCGNATGWVQVLRDPRLAKAIYAMHQRPGVNWKVEDLAREAGLSRSLFAERFLAATGTTPARYLTELRMRLAVQYITHEGQALEKVAFSLGYQSLAAFSRAFKRITGQPPGALRATAR